MHDLAMLNEVWLAARAAFAWETKFWRAFREAEAQITHAGANSFTFPVSRPLMSLDLHTP
jgi:hypothetical protein